MVLTGDTDNFSKHYLGLISKEQFVLMEMTYFDKLKVNLAHNRELVDSCKNATPDIENQ